MNHNIKNHALKFEVVLIGKTIDTSGEFSFIPDFFDVSIYTYNIDLTDGITFNIQCGFHKSNEMRGAFTKKNISYIRENIFTR